MYYDYFAILQENIHGKVCIQLHWNRTSALVFFCKYSTYRQQNFFFRGSLEAGKKLFKIHFNIINTFSKFICDFRLVAKALFSEAVVVVAKTRNMGIYTSFVPEFNLKIYIWFAAYFALNVIRPCLLSSILEGRIYTPLVLKSLKQYYM